MPNRKCRRTAPFQLYDPDTNKNPFMLVDTVEHVNHAIRAGMQLWTVCGIQPETNALRTETGRFKYRQKPSTEMNCLLCLSGEEW